MGNSLRSYSGQISTWGRKIGKGRFMWRTFQRQVAKRILRRDMVLKLKNNRSIWLPRESEFSSVAWVMDGLVDDGAETVLHGLHPVGSAFLDIGAHFGFYAVWMSDVASKVYAFEPDPRLHAALRRNLVPQANAVILPVALSGKSGPVSFVQAASAPLSKIGTAEEDTSAGKKIKVTAVSLDDFWIDAGRPVVGSMKVDTEGHETSVFAGGMECIRCCLPLILVETDLAAMRGYWPEFAALGYRLGVLREKVMGRPTQSWFGGIDELPLTTGMFFLAPPAITEPAFTAQVAHS